MINMMLLACVGCASPNKVADLNPNQVHLNTGDWTCKQISKSKDSWGRRSTRQSIVRVNVQDCNMKEGSAFVMKQNGSHSHHKMNKIGDCKWAITLLLKNTTCESIDNVSIVQNY